MSFGPNRVINLRVCPKQGVYFNNFFILNKDRVSNLQWLTYTKILVKRKESREVLYGNKFAWINSHWSRVENAWTLQKLFATTQGLGGRLRAVSLFSVVHRAKREKRKWPRAWLMARDGRGTKKERLPAKPERMVFHGLVIFWRQNWSVDRPGTWNVTLEFAWTTEVFLLFFLKRSLCSA